MEFIYNKTTVVKAPTMPFHKTGDKQLHSYMNANNAVKVFYFQAILLLLKTLIKNT